MNSCARGGKRKKLCSRNRVYSRFRVRGFKHARAESFPTRASQTRARRIRKKKKKKERTSRHEKGVFIFRGRSRAVAFYEDK